MVENIDHKVKEIVAYAYEHTTAMRRRLDEAGINPADIQGVADLEQLPVLHKDDLVAMQQADPPFGGMLAIPPDQVTHIFFSPGPIYEPGPAPDDSAWEVAVAFLQQAGFEAGDVVLNSLSYHLVPAGYLFDVALTRLGCTVVPGGTGNSALQLKMMQDLGVTGYVGTPSFLMTLINNAETAGLNFKEDFKLQRAMVTAEPIMPKMREAFTQTYGLTLANAYGTADFGLIALNLDGGLAMTLLNEPVVEVIDTDTGKSVGAGDVGEVVVTSFSKVYPLIRLATGDMAVNVDPRPGVSAQKERALILVGRSGEAVKVRGMFVHPNQLRFAAGQVPGVKMVQGVVTRPDGVKDLFDVRVELEPGTDETAVTAQLKPVIQNLCRVKVNTVTMVPPKTIAADDPGMIDAREWD